jgi:hypothetical protein
MAITNPLLAFWTDLQSRSERPESLDLGRLSRAWRKIQAKARRTPGPRPAAIDQHIRKLTVDALELARRTGRKLVRIRCPAISSDHPGIPGYVKAKCRGCKTLILVAESHQARDASVILALLCECCFEVSAPVRLPREPDADAWDGED